MRKIIAELEKKKQAKTPHVSFIKVKAPDIEKSADKNTQIHQIIGSKNRSHRVCRRSLSAMGKVLGCEGRQCDSQYERKWKIKRNRLSLHSRSFKKNPGKIEFISLLAKEIVPLSYGNELSLFNRLFSLQYIITVCHTLMS